MDESFTKYLESIGMQNPMISFVEKNYEIVESIFAPSLGENIEDIFIEETISEDNKRKYENIYFFTKSYFIEIQIFSENKIQIFPLRNNRNLGIKKINYEFRNATSESRMTINSNSVLSRLILNASGTNCDKLNEIMHKYLIPNINI